MSYKYYSQCVACLLIFLMMSFDEEKIFISMKFILSGVFFSFMFSAFCFLSRRYLPILILCCWGSQRTTLSFSDSLGLTEHRKAVLLVVIVHYGKGIQIELRKGKRLASRRNQVRVSSRPLQLWWYKMEVKKEKWSGQNNPTGGHLWITSSSILMCPPRPENPCPLNTLLLWTSHWWKESYIGSENKLVENYHYRNRNFNGFFYSYVLESLSNDFLYHN